jgi:sortase A
MRAAGAPHPLLRGVILALGMIGLWQIGEGLYIHAKARLAQALIARAWVASREAAAPVRPWPWADTYPVARLRVPAHDIDLYVLEGDSGRSLAFGPGHMTRTALPGQAGNAVISAHRDTHFAFLKDLRAGEELQVELPVAPTRRYRVRDTAVVNQNAMAITGDTRTPTLTLVTCYPFDALVPRGPLRYVVSAEAVDGKTY